MLELIYFLLSLLGFSYFLFKKRFFDFYSIAFFSQQIYFLPLMVQFFVGSKNMIYPIYFQVYIVAILIVISVIVGALFLDKNGSDKKYKTVLIGIEYHAFFSTFIALLAFVFCYIKIGNVLFISEKEEILNAIDHMYVLWSTASLYGLAVSYYYNNRKLFCVNIFLILLTVYIGFRSFAAIAFLTWLLIFFIKKGEKVSLLRDYLFVNIFSLIIGLIFFIYKGVYIAIKYKDYEMAWNNITDVNYLMQVVFLNSEPFAIQRILSDVMQYNFFIGLGNFKRIILTFLIFGNQTGIDTKTFNGYFQSYLYGEVGYGMGDNIWAHIYSSGGWLLLIIFIFIFSISLFISSYKVYRNESSFIPLLTVLFCYWAFYLHRNDLFYQLGLEKRILIVFIFISVISCILYHMKRVYLKR